MISIDLSNSTVKDEVIPPVIQEKLREGHRLIRSQSGGIENAWVEFPNIFSQSDVDEIKEAAEYVRKNADVLLVIGVGGSYLGAYAGMRLLGDYDFDIDFLGKSFDPVPLERALRKYKDKRVCVNVISKSGTTMEISAVFKIIDEFMRKKYPSKSEYLKRIFITTDATKGTLRQFADTEGFKSFVVPDRVGGRYSVLSAVGLFPFAVAGIDIGKIMDGARKAYVDLNTEFNDAYKYAVARYFLHTKYCKSVEVLASFYEGMNGFGSWWQQLFSESEGKDGKGLFVAPMIYTRDLHSMGQFIQQGTPMIMETVINVQQPPDTSTGLNEYNSASFMGTVKAHADAGIPVVIINMEKIDEENLGYLFYFFQISCAMSAYLLGVNPYDQPGVEFYKKNIKDLLATTPSNI